MDKKLIELSRYRLEQAERCIKSAKILVADDDYYVISKNDVSEQINNAEKFYHVIGKYLREKKGL